jgi:hypothetical protein
VGSRLVNEEVAPCNSFCLIKMMQDLLALWTLNIELSALVEGLDVIVNFTYKMEGDTQLVVKAGESVGDLLALYQCDRV